MKIDKQSYQALFQEFHNVLSNYSNTIVHNYTDAEDVVQDVFIQLWNKRNDIKIETKIKYYLFTAVRNRSIEVLRKRKMHHKYVEAEKNVKESVTFLGDKVEDMVLKEKLHRSIRQLPPKCQEIFVMNKLNGLTYKEIAENLNLSSKTVENQIARALKLLRLKFK